MIYIKLLILLIISLSVMSCSLLERRDFEQEMSYEDDDQIFRPNHDFMVIAGDSGRDYRSNEESVERFPASESDRVGQRMQRELIKELNYLENQMREDEYDDYLNIKEKIGGISEKIYFLRLPHQERRAYLVSKGIIGSPNRYSSQSVARLRPTRGSNIPSRSIASVSSQDVYRGMKKDEVLKNWGRPERLDIAGDPKFENERWIYRKNGGVKYVYFEGGQVEGWSQPE